MSPLPEERNQGDFNVHIRPGRVDDHETLLGIWLDSVRATHTFLSEKDIEELTPVVREQALPALELWVACSDTGELLGFMGLDGEKVEALFVAPACMGMGVGKLFLGHARQLRGVPLLVDVNEQNPAATEFYRSQGFEVIGRSEHDGGGRPFPLLHMRERTSVPQRK